MDLLRQEIDTIDTRIIDLLGERFDVVTKIADVKAKEGLDIVDNKRFEQLVQNLSIAAKERGLPDGLIGDLYEVIHRYAIAKQKLK